MRTLIWVEGDAKGPLCVSASRNPVALVSWVIAQANVAA
jgi:hypothetical protein